MKYSLESALTAPETIDNSPEEEALLQEELLSKLSVSNTVIDEVKRAEEIREGLADLSNVASTLESASLQNLALIQIAGNMALAGTGISCEQIMPSLESYQGTVVSTESLSDTVKKLWERILSALKRLVEMFAGFWDRLFNAIDRLSNANKRLATRAKGIDGLSAKEDEIVLTTERSKFEINGTVCNTATGVVKGLVEARRQLKVLVNGYVDTTINVGNKLVAATNQTTDDMSEYLEGLTEAGASLDLKSVASLLNCRQYVDSRFAVGEVVVSPAMLGNRSLFVTTDSREANSLLSKADLVRTRRVQLAVSTTKSERSYGAEGHIRTFSSNDIQAICAEVDLILSVVRDFVRGGKRSQLAKLNKTVLDVTDNAQKKLSGTVTNDLDASYLRSASRFATAFTTWSQNPHDALCTHLLSVCRACISVGNKSIALHR